MNGWVKCFMDKKRVELSLIDLDNLNTAIGSVAGRNEYFGLRLRRACMARPETFHVEQWNRIRHYWKCLLRG